MRPKSTSTNGASAAWRTRSTRRGRPSAPANRRSRHHLRRHSPVKLAPQLIHHRETSVAKAAGKVIAKALRMAAVAGAGDDAAGDRRWALRSTQLRSPKAQAARRSVLLRWERPMLRSRPMTTIMKRPRSKRHRQLWRSIRLRQLPHRARRSTFQPHRRSHRLHLLTLWPQIRLNRRNLTSPRTPANDVQVRLKPDATYT